MYRHLPLVQRVHPMLPGGGGEETVCAHCHERWPCDTTTLLSALSQFVRAVKFSSGVSLEFAAQEAEKAIAKVGG